MIHSQTEATIYFVKSVPMLPSAILCLIITSIAALLAFGRTGVVLSRCAWVLLLTGLLTASGCEQKPGEQKPGKVTSEDVSRDAGQAVNTAVEFSQQNKEEFEKGLDSRLSEVGGELATLRQKGRDLQGQAKTNWDRKMADLETKRDAARAKLTEVSNSSGKAWKDIQKGAQSAWDELDKAFRDASQEF